MKWVSFLLESSARKVKWLQDCYLEPVGWEQMAAGTSAGAIPELAWKKAFWRTGGFMFHCKAFCLGISQIKKTGWLSCKECIRASITYCDQKQWNQLQSTGYLGLSFQTWMPKAALACVKLSWESHKWLKPLGKQQLLNIYSKSYYF